METKVCRNCQEEKSTEEFWSNFIICKECSKKAKKSPKIARFAPVVLRNDFDLLEATIKDKETVYNSFDYYDYNGFEAVFKHLITIIGLSTESKPAIYGHLDYDPESDRVWMKIGITNHGFNVRAARNQMVKRLIHESVRRGIKETYISIKPRGKGDILLKRILVGYFKFRFVEDNEDYEVRKKVVDFGRYKRRHGVEVEA